MPAGLLVPCGLLFFKLADFSAESNATASWLLCGLVTVVEGLLVLAALAGVNSALAVHCSVSPVSFAQVARPIFAPFVPDCSHGSFSFRFCFTGMGPVLHGDGNGKARVLGQW